jgi:hypothetical protein
MAARIITSILMTITAGWFLMLAVGVVHHEWIPACPTIGFWWAVLLASLIRGALYQHDFSGDAR